MLLTDVQVQRLAQVGRAREQLRRDRERVGHAERVMRRLCGEAVSAGVPLRRIAAVAEVSYETVRVWAAEAAEAADRRARTG